MKTIDGTNLILGRLATKVAKAAINGEQVTIVNAEKVVVTGKPSFVLAKYKQTADRGAPLKGPRYHRSADRIVRRAIRGMIPYKTAKGKEAFQRVMTYIGVPPEFASAKLETFEDININNTNNIQFITIKEISNHLGAK